MRSHRVGGGQVRGGAVLWAMDWIIVGAMDRYASY